MRALQKALVAHRLFMIFIKRRQYCYADRALDIRDRYFYQFEELTHPWLHDCSYPSLTIQQWNKLQLSNEAML